MRLTDVAQHWLAEIIQEGDVVVDATLGNGFDALFLAQKIGEAGVLFAFDVQTQAIKTSQALLADEPCQQYLLLTGHETMKANIPQYFHGHIKVIMFNLGWLPNSDKSVITQTKTTIQALAQSLEFLATNGRLSVMVYPGHAGGDYEAKQVMNWLEQTCENNKYFIYKAIILPNRPTAPILLQVTKL
ncbi:MAG: class I SAM-dependent methyltransferase [Ghiorsea sp.]|nr:class I SAM-dependent methyltransferase [Ghiorsea sp.]